MVGSDARSTFETWVNGLDATGPGPQGEPGEVRTTHSGALLLVRGDLVVKLHHPRTDARVLSDRLQVAADPALGSLLLAPLAVRPEPVPAAVSAELGGSWRWASLWPRVEVLDPSGSPGDALPWTEAGALLAGLHGTRVPAESQPAESQREGVRLPGVLSPGLPPAGDLERFDRALARLERAPEPTRHVAAQAAADRRAVLQAGRLVRGELTEAPAGPDGQPSGMARGSGSLVHGDWHLGQLGRRPAGMPGGQRWRLIDVDDLGIGCPATDLARPSAFWAVGLLDDASWSAFVEGYREAGGPAVPATGEVWPYLDLHARAAVIVAATRSVLDAVASGAPLDDDGTALVQACHRMVGGSSARVGTRGAAGRRPV